MGPAYKVVNLIDDTYQVLDLHDYERIVFQGSLTDCEAWIRLTEGGYM